MSDTFAELIKSKRVEKNISRSELARRVGITPQYAMDIERGRIIPSEEKIEKMIGVLEIEEKIAFRLAGKIPIRIYEQAKNEYFEKE